jgi:hypothetical protein
LFAEFKALTTRYQYTLVAGSDEITEQTRILRADKVEETCEARLRLADRVLGAALQAWEFEVNLELHDKLQEIREETALLTAKDPMSGGYH